MMKVKRLAAISISAVLILSVSYAPFRAYAAIDENGLSLDIDTSTINLTSVWSQVKNAAIIQLIAQKMQKCARVGQFLWGRGDSNNPNAPNSHPRESRKLIITLERGVLDKGNVFMDKSVGSTGVPTLGVGPWLSKLLDGVSTGRADCQDYTDEANLFDIFAYIYKNYNNDLSADGSIKNTSKHLGQEDRLKIVCNKDDLSQTGILSANAYSGNVGCKDGENYYGLDLYDKEKAMNGVEEYLATLYQEIKDRANNKYIVSWNNLGDYDGIRGYYLYSNDFEVQCGGVKFQDKKSSEDGKKSKKGYQITDDGMVKQGFYILDANDTSAATSFLGQENSEGEMEERKLTCSDLIDEMNEHIKQYLQYVNYEMYGLCKENIDKVIDEKKREITNKYLNNNGSTSEQKQDASLVIDEYNRIQNEREYMARTENEEEILIRVENEEEDKMPTEYIWTCRSHLPYINVVVKDESSLKDELEEEFTSYCYEALDLSWVMCPIIDAVSDTADGLSEAIEGFF